MDRTPEHLFDQTLSLHRLTGGVDAGGAGVNTWPAIVPAMRGRVQPMPGDVGEHHGRQGTLRRWRVYLAGDTAVRPGDRLQWAGHVMAVRSVRDVHAQGRLIVIDTQEVR